MIASVTAKPMPPHAPVTVVSPSVYRTNTFVVQTYSRWSASLTETVYLLAHCWAAPYCASSHDLAFKKDWGRAVFAKLFFCSDVPVHFISLYLWGHPLTLAWIPLIDKVCWQRKDPMSTKLPAPTIPDVTGYSNQWRPLSTNNLFSSSMIVDNVVDTTVSFRDGTSLDPQVITPETLPDGNYVPVRRRPRRVSP